MATYCIGQAASGAAIILAAGTKGKRFALPHAKIMLHQPYGGITGQAEDIRIQAEEILKDKKLLNEILAKHTGQDPREDRQARPSATGTWTPRRPRRTGWSTRSWRAEKDKKKKKS